MIISLTGFMGSGKSTLAERLSLRFSIPSLDLDKEIEREYNKSIIYIFETHGEDWFRSLEEKELRQIIDDYSQIEKHLSDNERTCIKQIERAGKTTLNGESELIDYISSLNSERPVELILSCGGGTLLNDKNAELIRNHTLSVFVNTDLDTITERLKNEIQERPLLREAPDKIEETILKLYRQREEMYHNCANIIYNP